MEDYIVNAHGTGIKVLVVEDSALLALETQEKLESAGFKVIGPAASLEKAFQLVAHQQIDIAVLDINLNGTLVFPLAQLLHARNVPVIFLTGYDSQSILPSDFIGCPCLEKPLMEESVVNAVSQLVHNKLLPAFEQRSSL